MLKNLSTTYDLKSGVKKCPNLLKPGDHFKLTHRLSPSAFDLLEFIFVNKLTEGK